MRCTCGHEKFEHTASTSTCLPRFGERCLCATFTPPTPSNELTVDFLVTGIQQILRFELFDSTITHMLEDLLQGEAFDYTYDGKYPEQAP